MRKMIRIFLPIVVILALIGAGVLAWERLSRIKTAELEKIVQRDGLPFYNQGLPDELLDHLANHRVVLVGELHFLSEHRQLLANLLRDLHARGFRQYLFEWSEATDWLLADYVNDGGLEPEWRPPHDIGGTTLTAIRDFNRTLPADERIQVHGIDVHLQDYGGTQSWLVIMDWLSRHLPEPGPITSFLQGKHDTDEAHQAQLELFQAKLVDRRADLTIGWGEDWYNLVCEMIEVELQSLAIRAMRERDYDESVRLREEVIKELADRRIQENPQGTLINFGATHAQKKHLWGTEIEWLGDYLVHKSEVVNGSINVLQVSAARIVNDPGSETNAFNLGDSPENELFRVMNGIYPDQTVFLPLDDPLFNGRRVPVNLAGDVYVGYLEQIYDAFILLPLAHRDYVGD